MLEIENHLTFNFYRAASVLFQSDPITIRRNTWATGLRCQQAEPDLKALHARMGRTKTVEPIDRFMRNAASPQFQIY